MLYQLSYLATRWERVEPTNCTGSLDLSASVRGRAAWHNWSMLRMSRWLWSIVAIVALTAGCTETPANPSNGASYSQTDLTVGTGAEAGNTGQVTVNYTGWLYDPTKTDSKGLPFDTSIGRTPFVFVLGTGDVIKGWEQGIPGMKSGGVRRLVIPPVLAYGSVRSGPIPPNTTIVFDIELVSVP